MNETRMDLSYMGLMFDTDILGKIGNLSTLANNLQEKSNMCQMLSSGSTYVVNNSPYSPLDAFSHLKNASKYLILVVPETIEQILDIMEQDIPDATIKYISKYIYNSELFNHTLGHCYVVWDKDRDICGIWEVCIHKEKSVGIGSVLMETVLDLLTLNIPSTTTLWLNVSLTNKMFGNAVSLYTKYGFDNPFIYKNDPFTKNDWNAMGGAVQLTRNNEYIDPEDIEKEEARTEIYYIIEQSINLRKNGPQYKYCSINLKYKTSFARWLNKLPQANLTLNNDNTLTQKELGGIMTITNIHLIDDKTYGWELVLDKNHETIMGLEDQVNIIKGRYTFHTHPINTISSRQLAIAVPSGKDFAGFLILALSKNGIFHSVITEEGIYIITLHQNRVSENSFEALKNTIIYDEVIQAMEWTNIGFIQDTSKYRDELIADYLQKIEQQQQRFIGGPIFSLQFLMWNDILNGKYFTIYYPTIYGECFPTERNILEFNSLYPNVQLDI